MTKNNSKENFSSMSEDEILRALKEFDGGKAVSASSMNEKFKDIKNKKSITVAIIGLPNAGKSSLMNLIVGEKLAAISSKVQTTRNAIRGVKIVDNVQIVFVDSPGVIDAKSTMDKFLLENARRTMKECELLLVMMDIRTKDSENFQLIVDNIAKYTHKEKVLVINKIDLFDGDKLQEQLQAIHKKYQGVFEKFFDISVAQNKGVDGLLNFIKESAKQDDWLYEADQISESPMKFFAAEITRERIFENVHSELPYSVLVETEYYKELDDGSIHIDQTIYVNKENHKSMIIGAGARMVKKIGIEAREQLEQILGVKVTLKLYVKFKEDWTKNENFIKNVIGISGS
jgi:GTP-binding protein Era